MPSKQTLIARKCVTAQAKDADKLGAKEYMEKLGNCITQGLTSTTRGSDTQLCSATEIQTGNCLQKCSAGYSGARLACGIGQGFVMDYNYGPDVIKSKFNCSTASNGRLTEYVSGFGGSPGSVSCVPESSIWRRGVMKEAGINQPMISPNGQWSAVIGSDGWFRVTNVNSTVWSKFVNTVRGRYWWFQNDGKICAGYGSEIGIPAIPGCIPGIVGASFIRLSNDGFLQAVSTDGTVNAYINGTVIWSY